jgi:uncharacterized protein YcaQ
VEKLKPERVNRFLLHKQHLAPQARGHDVLETVQDICALHSTAPLTPYLSLWSRVKGFEPEQLDRELYESRNLVRVTCMRATLHIVPSERLPSFFQATKKRQRRGLRQMGYLLVQSGLCREGEEEPAVQRLLERIAAVVAQRGPSTVAELSERVPELAAKFQYAPDKPYGGEFSVGSQLVPWMCVLGLLVRTRPRGTWRSNLYEYAPLAGWLPDVDLEALTPAEAQARLVRWYLAALGPSTVEDIAWWSGFGKGEAQKALSALGDELVEVEIEGLGERHWMLAADQQPLQEVAPGREPIVNLLPSLDPYIMGYRDRRRFLEREHHDQVFDRAGNAFATVWFGGRVVGVWREQDATIELLVWEDVDSKALTAEAQRVGRFLSGQDAQPVVKPYPPDLYVKNPFTLARKR